MSLFSIISPASDVQCRILYFFDNAAALKPFADTIASMEISFLFARRGTMILVAKLPAPIIPIRKGPGKEIKSDFYEERIPRRTGFVLISN